jgi:hypothetical protein
MAAQSVLLVVIWIPSPSRVIHNGGYYLRSIADLRRKNESDARKIGVEPRCVTRERKRAGVATRPLSHSARTRVREIF